MSGMQAQYPLARFGGRRPPRPDWYRRLRMEPEQVFYPEVEGAKLELLVWGDAGRPGVLLAHGNRAHARWWGPVAAYLAVDYRVASLSWSGMGGSDWRPEYSVGQYARELFVAAEAGGLWAADVPPVFIAHSFGTHALAKAIVDRGNELSGAIFVDGVVGSNRRPVIPDRISDPRFETLAKALSRFSLRPSQDCENPFILDDIARASLKKTRAGWAWRFDPEFYHKFAFTDVWPAIVDALCPIAIVNGEKSNVLTPAEIELQKTGSPAGTPYVEIPNAGHHIMADQPLALTAALRALIAHWVSR